MSTFLTPADEQQLFEEYRRTGDKQIESRLLESQLGLVGRLTSLYQLKGIDRRDLFQEGAIGLLHAIRKFDPSRGTRLSTYAAYWIRAFEFRYTLANYRLVRVGTTQAQRRIFFRLATVRARLSSAGIEPTASRLAALLGVDTKSVVETEARLNASDLSLDAPAYGDEGRSRISSMATADIAADQLLADYEVAEIVRFERDRYRASLSPRRLALFDARWVDEEPPNLREMGDRMGVSRERARQLEHKMLTELGDRVRPRVAA
jgi:RNA polymerase sigma-32 factor